MCLVNRGIYADISNLPPLAPKRWGEFRQRKLPKEKQQGPLSYLFFLQNEGLINNYEPLEFPDTAAEAYGAPGYRGEVWLVGGRGEIRTLQWSPNRLRYGLELRGPDIIVVNQRYDPGWRADDGRPVFPLDDLIALSVNASDRTVGLYYRPPFFYWGCLVSALGAVGAVVIWKKG
jgi:hypothetical protein